MNLDDDGAQTAKLSELIADERQAMFTTTAPDGTLISRPMAVQQAEFGGDLWFFAEAGSRKVEHLTRDPQVNVTFSGDDSWVSLTGRASVVRDLTKKRELWNPVVEAWFPDGKDDDGIVLLHVDGDSAEFWDSPGGRLATALSFAKAKLTGQPYSGGDNAKLTLP
ncbi:General stress protein 26 [Quadrisphaera granulorum]|uniref:General stress protein 26 n=1 Tax=Quadrisphaera granulorum TaxID=317664 RepID=A0A316AVK6_9ACTN|nr:pyridoxamine 5'-phosphate oxidase family protein [Quadrisphaera granulorum]PWJ54127.1 general stress protein 26 [Quadrisphaera granulorum]SZE96266.1 General stress protein 26 [Quadrisphaera granulorum]